MFRYLFPKELNFSFKSYAFLTNIDNEVWKKSKEKIEFDFSATQIIYTNHLAMLLYIIQKILRRENSLIGIIGTEKFSGEILVHTLYEHYAIIKHPFIYPSIISYHNNNNPKLWLSELKSLNLAYFEKIKIIISELFTNLKMHTIYGEGSYAGFIDECNDYLFLSIVNYDIQIRKTLEFKQHMIFANDFEALIWALKKTNTTRNGNESGGLGLYLLRKYIHELDGECIIVTGDCFLKLDKRCFEANNANSISYTEHQKLRQNYGGNIITLKLPLKKCTSLVKKQKILRVRINLGDL